MGFDLDCVLTLDTGVFALFDMVIPGGSGHALRTRGPGLPDGWVLPDLWQLLTAACGVDYIADKAFRLDGGAHLAVPPAGGDQSGHAVRRGARRRFTGRFLFGGYLPREAHRKVTLPKNRVGSRLNSGGKATAVPAGGLKAGVRPE